MIRYPSIISLLAAGLIVACANGTEGARRLTEPVQVAFDGPLNLIVLQTWIGDEGPFRFFLDSGATSTVIDAQLAKRVGLNTTQAYTRRGTAPNSQVTAATVRGGVDFTLAPGFEVHVDHVITAPFTSTGEVMIGDRYDGIFGSAIFFSYVVEIDYDEQEIIFHDPDRYRYEGKGTALDLHFPSVTPKLPAITVAMVNGDRRLDDMPMFVDSGGQTMGTASVAKRSEWNQLVEPSSPIVDVLGVTGLSNDPEGTTHDAFVTQIDRFVMGPFEFDDALVSYSEGGPPLGAMGASLLHRFTAVFDYSRKRLILEPNSRFHEPPMVDHSGAMLVISDAEDRTFEVMFVSSGTPAQEAGLRRGDVIQSIDGMPTPEIDLNEARAMLSRTNEYRLQVRRDGQQFETTLSTRSLFHD